MRVRHLIGRAIRTHRIHIAVGALLFYLACYPATVVLFPDSNLWLALLVLTASTTQALLSIADLLEDE